jgi:hypothetical protein
MCFPRPEELQRAGVGVIKPGETSQADRPAKKKS